MHKQFSKLLSEVDGAVGALKKQNNQLAIAESQIQEVMAVGSFIQNAVKIINTQYPRLEDVMERNLAPNDLFKTAPKIIASAGLLPSLLVKAMMQGKGSRPLVGGSKSEDSNGSDTSDDSDDSDDSESEGRSKSKSKCNRFLSVRDRTAYETTFRMMQLLTQAKGFREWFSLMLMKNNLQAKALTYLIPLKLTRSWKSVRRSIKSGAKKRKCELSTYLKDPNSSDNITSWDNCGFSESSEDPNATEGQRRKGYYNDTSYRLTPGIPDYGLSRSPSGRTVAGVDFMVGGEPAPHSHIDRTAPFPQRRPKDTPGLPQMTVAELETEANDTVFVETLLNVIELLLISDDDKKDMLPEIRLTRDPRVSSFVTKMRAKHAKKSLILSAGTQANTRAAADSYTEDITKSFWKNLDEGEVYTGLLGLDETIGAEMMQIIRRLGSKTNKEKPTDQHNIFFSDGMSVLKTTEQKVRAIQLLSSPVPAHAEIGREMLEILNETFNAYGDLHMKGEWLLLGLQDSDLKGGAAYRYGSNAHHFNEKSINMNIGAMIQHIKNTLGAQIFLAFMDLIKKRIITIQNFMNSTTCQVNIPFLLDTMKDWFKGNNADMFFRAHQLGRLRFNVSVLAADRSTHFNDPEILHVSERRLLHCCEQGRGPKYKLILSHAITQEVEGAPEMLKRVEQLRNIPTERGSFIEQDGKQEGVNCEVKAFDKNHLKKTTREDMATMIGPIDAVTSQLERNLGYRLGAAHKETRKIKHGIDLVKNANLMDSAGWTPTNTFRIVDPAPMEERVGGGARAGVNVVCALDQQAVTLKIDGEARHGVVLLPDVGNSCDVNATDLSPRELRIAIEHYDIDTMDKSTEQVVTEVTTKWSEEMKLERSPSVLVSVAEGRSASNTRKLASMTRSFTYDHPLTMNSLGNTNRCAATHCRVLPRVKRLHPMLYGGKQYHNECFSCSYSSCGCRVDPNECDRQLPFLACPDHVDQLKMKASYTESYELTRGKKRQKRPPKRPAFKRGVKLKPSVRDGLMRQCDDDWGYTLAMGEAQALQQGSNKRAQQRDMEVALGAVRLREERESGVAEIVSCPPGVMAGAKIALARVFRETPRPKNPNF